LRWSLGYLHGGFRTYGADSTMMRFFYQHLAPMGPEGGYVE